MDIAHKETDRIIDEIESRLEKEYAQATKEVEQKLLDHLEKFKAEDAKKARLVKDGKLSKEKYVKWRYEQTMTTKHWRDLRETLSEDLTRTNMKTASIINGYMPEAYAINHNYLTYEIEKGVLLDTSYTLYSRETVENLIKDKPNLLPFAKVKNAKDMSWHRKQITSAVLQGVLQGEAIPDIAKRMQKVVKMDNNLAVSNARTFMTSAQNRGRIDSMNRAEKMGIHLKKKWIASLDSRTRDAHRRLDGQTQEINEPFDSTLGEIMYPADPNARAGNIRNCRCTLISVVDGFDYDVSDETQRANKLKGMSYEEWKGAHNAS